MIRSLFVVKCFMPGEDYILGIFDDIKRAEEYKKEMKSIERPFFKRINPDSNVCMYIAITKYRLNHGVQMKDRRIARELERFKWVEVGNGR